MEHTSLDSDSAPYRFHSGAPAASTSARAAAELQTRLSARAQDLGIARLQVERVGRPSVPVGPRPERLIEAYSRALVDALSKEPALVVLDAHLAVDTGQLPARQAYPSRCFEFGIAEMDMVSAAGGMALSGLLPVCHSFACFLAPRANEHLYDNATERSRVIYVASLAGLLPAGPGHSHQGVRDVSAVGAIPGMVVLAPSCEAEVPLALAWAIRDATGSVWLRLESAPRHVPFSSPADHALIPGKGATLRAGRDALFVGYGPALLAEAYHAAELLEQDGLHVGGISLPWVNQVDPSWLARTVGGVPHLLCLDDHYTVGGQADRLAAAIAALGPGPWPRLHSLGLTGLPACGGAAEVPAHHGLDAASLARRVRHAAWG